MNSMLLRTALITGLVIGALNIVFAGVQYGFDTLPVWFYLAQLLLIPAMILPMRFFPQAAMTRDFGRRAALFGLGWAVPYAIYKFAGDVLSPTFNPAASLISYLVMVLVFAVLFATIRKPQS
ncbi:hypothetical protein GCM10008955_15880 [Deinococcus malanensis]|uniref:Uncharacterized protein n=2 Tax=Deinococcus malanensis TaxID=1706855 RepID=A0ABQ2EV14_9DEIO|nr:hypothetical protein GCM10008955_15880 [Deinococcus malanensis]